jgi:hypothetical protein
MPQFQDPARSRRPERDAPIQSRRQPAEMRYRVKQLACIGRPGRAEQPAVIAGAQEAFGDVEADETDAARDRGFRQGAT